MQRFKGKVAIVTGSTHRIGKGIAERFAREGASVVVNVASSQERVQQAVRRMGSWFYVFNRSKKCQSEK